MIRLLVALFGPVLKVQPTPPHVPYGARDAIVFRASQRYLGYRYFQAGLKGFGLVAGALVFLVAMAAAGSHGKPPPQAVWVVATLLEVAAVLGLLLGLVIVRLDWEYHCYVMTDRCVRIRHGIWEQIEATLTYANVQNVRVVQGPLERLFGFASVVVDTAGSGGRSEQQDPLLQHHRGVIRGIEDANALRDRIMDRMRHSKSSGLGDPDDHKEADPQAAPSELALLRDIRDEARGLAAGLKHGAGARLDGGKP